MAWGRIVGRRDGTRKSENRSCNQRRHPILRGMGARSQGGGGQPSTIRIFLMLCLIAVLARSASSGRTAVIWRGNRQPDSAVEGPGFEPSVPRFQDGSFRLAALPVPPQSPTRFCEGDRRFESASLQRRVCCEPWISRSGCPNLRGSIFRERDRGFESYSLQQRAC